MSQFIVVNGVLKQYIGEEKAVTVPDGICEIGYGAFRENAFLQQVTMPKGVTKIGSQAFAGCTQLMAVHIPQGVTEIGYSAFERCSRLAAISLPEGLVLLDRMAFLDCTALAEIGFPDTLRTVGRDALRGTAWLNEQPEGVVYAGRLALFAKGAIVSAAIRQGTVKICVDAFRNCSTLSAVTLPDSLQELEDRAFQNCRKLKQIAIPRRVVRIGYRAFDECSKLQVLLESDAVEIGKLCFADSATVRITHMNPAQLPENIRQSAILAFAEDICNGVFLEEGFRGRFFKYLQSRRKLFYPLAMAHWNLLQVMLQRKMIPPEDVDAILEDMLSGEQAEATAALMQYKQQLAAGKEADLFDSWDDLELGWDLPEQEKSDADVAREWGTKKNSDGTLRLLLYHGDDLEITVPGRIGGQPVTMIAPAACSPTRYGIKRETAAHRRAIRTVTIEEGITEIGNHAFADCENLTRVTLPESIVRIGYDAFRNCRKLTELVIPQSVEQIERGAFAGCSNLKRIQIPDGVQLADDVFADCGTEIK